MSNLINDAMDLSDIAKKHNIELYSFTNINFKTFFLPYIGIEPNVVATATNIELNTISNPIIGNNGVCVIKVTNSKIAPSKTDYSIERLETMKSNAIKAYKLKETIENNAVIIDFRDRFF